MAGWLKRIFQPTIETGDPDRNYLARTFHAHVLGGAILMMLIVFIFILWTDAPASQTGAIASVAILLLLGLGVLRRGRFVPSVWLVVIALTGLAWVSAFYGGGLRNPNFLGITLIALMGVSIFVGQSQAIGYSLWGVLSGFGFFIAEQMGLLPKATLLPKVVTWGVQGVLIMVALALISVASFMTRRALERARLDLQERQRLNAKLEQGVEERTAELQAANHELEAFTYSVSHDLRAPLRGIDGYSHLLLEDYQDCLDEEGQQYLKNIRLATQKMNDLIDALLRLSRLTRAEITWAMVNLSELTRSILEEFQRNAPERQVEITIQPEVTASGDARLLQAVLENLLGNAWKFSSRQAQTRIEFGAGEADGKAFYFVRDNGAGFDMKYVDKIFQPFQRLHSPDEFEGSGVGLATVRRIIHRHGGRIWAEGAVGQGATFYFTLG